MSNAAVSVFDSRASLEYADSLGVAAVGTRIAHGHGDCGTLNPGNDGADANLGCRVNYGVVGEAKEVSHPLLLQDLCDCGSTLHSCLLSMS
jgi:hypothetical protein